MKNIAQMPRISVVVPAFNEAAKIADCIRALKMQTLQPYEIIVVDNNSTDATADIARSFSGVRVITETSQGICAARSTGFNTASGDIIARTDADSRPEADWLEVVAKYMANDPTLAAVNGPISYYDIPAKRMTHKVEIAIRKDLDKRLRNSSFLTGANMALRREVWQEIKIHTCSDETLHEDLDLAIHLQAHGKQIKFCTDMHVATSARRMSHSTKDFYRYMKRFETTYNNHGIYRTSLKVPFVIYMSLQPAFSVVYRTYNASEQPKRRTTANNIRR